jgi:Family of unknown function (DUF6788)
MRVPDHPTLIRRMLQARLKRLAGTRPIVGGSLGLVYRACGTASCRCHHGGPKHAAYQLTFKDRGRSRSVYVPKDLVGEVRQWLAAQRQLHQLLAEIHQLSIGLIRTHARHRRRRKGRP